MQGFKSFPEKITLELNSGITAVVGPNGSGKSNISDAVRWVLGEQSMKNLRGSKIEDIIFSGTENRKPVGFAEASVTFDNSIGSLPVDYAEVILTRRVYRSGESDFFINKSPCRLKDINELLMGTGVGKDGYSVVGQGRIDEILSTKSEDRRQVFEEAAGIMKYKTRKIEAERKIEQTRQNLLRINDIIGELGNQIEPLRIQSETAKKFLDLRERLKILEVNLFIGNMEKFKEKLGEIDEDAKNIREQIEQEQKNFDDLQDAKKNKQSEEETIELEVELAQKNMFEAKNSMEQNSSEIKLSNEKIENIHRNIQRLNEEIEEIKNRILTFESDKETREKKMLRLENDKKRFTGELAEREEELVKINLSIDADQLKVETIKSDIIEKINLNSDKKTELNSVQVLLEGIAKREQQIKEELQDFTLSADLQRMKKEDIADSLEKLHKEQNSEQKQIDDLEAKKNEVSQEIYNIEKDIEKLRFELNSKQSRFKFLNDLNRDNEGYHRSVKGILDECKVNNAFSQGIHGALAQLITVPKEFEMALETCLGQAVQNIVTDDEKSAKKAIDFLKKNNLGRATFLPVNVVKGKVIDVDSKGISACKGFMGVASNVVENDIKYKEIMCNLLGHTVIVDNLDNGIAMAKKFKYSFRIVTLEGDILNTSGAMSGGSANTKGSGILSRSREIKELAELIAQSEKMLIDRNKDFSSIKRSITKIVDEINDRGIRVKELQVAVAREEEKLTAVQDLIKNVQEKTAILKNEQEQIDIQKLEANETIQIKTNQIVELEAEIVKMQEEAKVLQESFKQVYEEKDRIYEQISDLKISLSSIEETASAIIEDSDRLHREIEHSNKDIARRENDIQKQSDEKIRIEESINTFDGRTQELLDLIQQKEQEIADKKSAKEGIQNELSLIEDEIIEKIKKLELLKEENNRFEIKKSRIDMEVETLQNRMWEEYQITIGKAEEYKRDIGSMTSAQREINKIKEQIKDLGVVNIAAIEEYAKTKERYEFLTKQRNDLQDAEDKLQKVIIEMISIMKRQFLEQFNHICVNFNEVFKELFGGGRATLRLSDEHNILESGIEIEVQPPGKKLQNMMLLSGGEKALTGIALLFAILKMNPSPFCILDEIEAALDDANVYIFADYLKKFTQNTQFILITHRKGTMEAADSLYGVTMEERGISKLISMKMAN